MERKRGSKTLPSKPASYQCNKPTRSPQPFCSAGSLNTVTATIPASIPSISLLSPTCPPNPTPILSSPKSTDWIQHEPLPAGAYAVPIFPSGSAPTAAEPSKLFPRLTPTTGNLSEPLWVHEPDPGYCSKQKQPFQFESNPTSTKMEPKLKTTS